MVSLRRVAERGDRASRTAAGLDGASGLGGAPPERRVIETVVNEANDAELESARPAVARILNACKSIGYGLASNNLYALLTKFAGVG